MSAESEVTTTARRCDEEWHYFAKDAMQCACGDRLRVTGGIAPFAVPRSRSELRRIAVQKGESLPDFVAASSESVPEVPPSVMDELVGRVCQRLEKGFYARNFQEAEDDARDLRAGYLASRRAVSSSPSVRNLPCRHCGAGEAVHEPMLGTCPSLDDGVYEAVDVAAPSVPAETPQTEYEQLLAKKLAWFEESAKSDVMRFGDVNNENVVAGLHELLHFAPAATHWAINVAISRLSALPPQETATSSLHERFTAERKRIESWNWDANKMLAEAAMAFVLLEQAHAELSSLRSSAERDATDAARWRVVAPTLHACSTGANSGYYMTTSDFVDAPMPTADQYADRLRAAVSLPTGDEQT